MEISYPCKVLMKAGIPVKLWEVSVSEKKLEGTNCTTYTFKTENHAELYRRFLVQQEGIKECEAVLNKYTLNKEDRANYEKLKTKLQKPKLPAMIEHIAFTTEYSFIPNKKRK